MTTAEHPKSCCTPNRPLGIQTSAEQIKTNQQAYDRYKAAAIAVAGGTGLLGTALAGIANDGEAPLRKTRIKPFRISATTVTNTECLLQAANS